MRTEGIGEVQNHGASRFGVHPDLLPVTRRFQPDPAAMDELVEALYRLLVDRPASESAPVPAASESACFLRPARVRNVS